MAIILGAILVVSLGANLFLGGLMTGAKRHGGRPTLGRIAKTMSDDSRLILRSELRERRPLMRERIAAVRTARREVGNALRAETFDAAALDRALAEVRLRGAAVQEIVHRTMAAAAARLPAEERAKLGRRGGRRRR